MYDSVSIATKTRFQPNDVTKIVEFCIGQGRLTSDASEPEILQAVLRFDSWMKQNSIKTVSKAIAQLEQLQAEAQQVPEGIHRGGGRGEEQATTFAGNVNLNGQFAWDQRGDAARTELVQQQNNRLALLAQAGVVQGFQESIARSMGVQRWQQLMAGTAENPLPHELELVAYWRECQGLVNPVLPDFFTVSPVGDLNLDLERIIAPVQESIDSGRVLNLLPQALSNGGVLPAVRQQAYLPSAK